MRECSFQIIDRNWKVRGKREKDAIKGGRQKSNTVHTTSCRQIEHKSNLRLGQGWQTSLTLNYSRNIREETRGHRKNHRKQRKATPLDIDFNRLLSYISYFRLNRVASLTAGTEMHLLCCLPSDWTVSEMRWNFSFGDLHFPIWLNSPHSTAFFPIKIFPEPRQTVKVTQTLLLSNSTNWSNIADYFSIFVIGRSWKMIVKSFAKMDKPRNVVG